KVESVRASEPPSRPCVAFCEAASGSGFCKARGLCKVPRATREPKPRVVRMHQGAEMKLHGVALSNYYNMAKHAILMKGIACELVRGGAGQEPECLARSPRGKVPLLETEHGYLSEADAILASLDEAFAGPKLFPQDAFARAEVRQLMKVQEVY